MELLFKFDSLEMHYDESRLYHEFVLTVTLRRKAKLNTTK
jgi:hypothetical protein